MWLPTPTRTRTLSNVLKSVALSTMILPIFHFQLIILCVSVHVFCVLISGNFGITILMVNWRTNNPIYIRYTPGHVIIESSIFDLSPDSNVLYLFDIYINTYMCVYNIYVKRLVVLQIDELLLLKTKQINKMIYVIQFVCWAIPYIWLHCI